MSIGRDVIRKFLNGDVDLIETNKLPEILSEIARTMITEGLSEDEYYVEIQKMAEKSYKESKQRLIYEEVVRRRQR